MTDSRTVLLGMNNPLSDDARHALAPYPANCAGWRVWRMLDDAAEAAGAPLAETACGPATWRVARSAYLGAFDRRNVLHARSWSRREAREAGNALRRELAGRRVIVLGVQTLDALDLPRTTWCEWRATDLDLSSPPSEPGHLIYCLLPHPSGRCREYNDAALRAAAGRVLLDEYRRSTW